MRRSPWPVLLALAGFSTLLNCFKPLTVDDSVYYYYAAHIAEHPLDPYGFTLAGVQSANQVLAPPVFLYWFALAVRLFGHHPFLWKLWLFPLNLLFVGCLYSLARRFARPRPLPPVALLALSPVFLPCWNLMLDVPALSLMLAALVLFMRACDRGTLTPALLAGLVAGVAMQTKYTAAVAPALFLVYGSLFRRVRAGVLAAALSALLFVGWEGFMSARYGASHFVLALKERDVPLWSKYKLLLPLVGTLGGTAAALILYALAALGRTRRLLVLAGTAIAAGFLAILFVPEPYTTLIPGARPDTPRLPLHTLVFGTLGAALFALTAAVITRLCRRGPDATLAPVRLRRYEYFLVLWLGLEVAAYFVLSPYEAVRRVMGVVIVGTLLTARLAGRTCRPRPRLVWGTVAFNGVLGLLAFAADFELYRSERLAAQAVAEHVRHRRAGGTVWYDAPCTFGFYADGFGMKSLLPAGARPRRDDWVVTVSKRYDLRCDMLWVETKGEPPVRLRVDSPLPLRSKYQAAGTPMEHHDGSAIEVYVFRLDDDPPPDLTRRRDVPTP